MTTTFLIISIVLLALITIINITTTVINYNQKQAFDDLIIKFVTNNQNYYESQKSVVKSQLKNTENAQKLIKDVSNMKNDFKKLFVETVDKLNEKDTRKSSNENTEEKKEKLQPMIDKLRNDMYKMRESKKKR